MANEDQENQELVWRAAEFQHFQKGLGWFLILGLATAVLAVFSLWRGNFFFALFIVIAGIMVAVLGNKKPRVLDFKVTDEGIEVGDELFYDYEELEGFDFIEHNHKLNELVVKRSSTINPFVHIPIDSKMSSKVEKKLEDHLPREEYEESILSILSDALRF